MTRRQDPIPPAIIGGRVFHKPDGASYASGCNRQAIRDASKSSHDYEGIDLDMNISLDGTPWLCHQLYPTKKDAWFDPTGFIDDSKRIDKLHDGQIEKLRVHYKGANRPILTAVQGAITCKNVRPRRLIPCYEAKGQDKRFLDPDWWYNHFLRPIHFSPIGVTPIAMSLPGTGNIGLKKLAAAHEAGVVTMWLWRGDISNATLKAHGIDLVKSRPKHPIYRVK